MSCCVCVKQSEVAIVESCGRYDRMAAPGCHGLTYCVESVRGTVSLRLSELDVAFESKTKDNVFIRVVITIQYQVLPGAIDVAFYSLENPRAQIAAYVKHFMRAEIPNHKLEELYLERQQIATQLKVDVDEKMDAFGYDITAALMTELSPMKQICDSLDRIVALERLIIAAPDGASAETTKRIRIAEANAEAMKLSAQGVADQRKAIVAGLQSSIEEFQVTCPVLSEQEILSMLLVTQYMDMLIVSARQQPDSRSGGDLMLMPNISTLPDIAKDLMATVIQSQPSRERVVRALRTGTIGDGTRGPVEELDDPEL